MKIVEVHNRIYLGDKLICGYTPGLFGEPVVKYITTDGVQHSFSKYELGVKKFNKFKAPKDIRTLLQLNEYELKEVDFENCNQLEGDISISAELNNFTFTSCSKLNSISVNCSPEFNQLHVNFKGCMNATSITMNGLPETSRIVGHGSDGVFNSCRNLTVAPPVYVTEGSLGGIFYNCNKLTEFTYLGDPSAATISTRYGYRGINSTGTFKYDSRYNYDTLISALPLGWDKIPVTVPNVSYLMNNPSENEQRLNITFGDGITSYNIIPPNTNEWKKDFYYLIGLDGQTPITGLDLSGIEHFDSNYLMSTNPIQITSVKSYGDKLKSVNLSTLDSSQIKKLSFNGSRQLVTAVLPASLDSITDISYLFSNCKSLTGPIEVNAPNSGNMMTYVFNGCEALTSATIHFNDTILYITNLFYGCKSIREIKLMGNPRHIRYKDNAFGNMISPLPENGTLIYDHNYETEYVNYMIDSFKSINPTWTVISDNAI